MPIQRPQPVLTPRPSYSLARRGLLRLLTLVLLAGTLSAQSAVDVPTLGTRAPFKRELAGGQTHSYRIALARRHYLNVVIDQQGVDVVVTLFGPDDNKVMEVDSPNGTRGPESVFAIAAVAGDYRLEVRSLEGDAPPGHYVLKVEELRPATKRDESRVIAEENFREAERLNLEGSPASVRNAARKYEEALLAFRALRNRGREAATLNNLGLTYSALGDRQRALELCLQALPLRRAVADRQGEATTLSNIGLMYQRLGQTPKSPRYLTKALSLFRSVGDRSGMGTALNNLGLVYTSLGQTQRAVNYFRQALPHFESARDQHSVATTYANLGNVYNSTGQKPQALDSYTRAQALFKAERDPRGEALALNGLGMVHYTLGEPQKALGYYLQARPVLEQWGQPGELAFVLNNLGLLYDFMGRKQEALEHYERALPILHRIGEVESEATTLSNVGMIYAGLGDGRSALRYYNQALTLARRLKHRALEASALNNLGHAYDSSGEWPTALGYFGRALKLHRATGNLGGAAVTLNNMGIIYKGLGEDWAANVSYSQAAALAQKMGTREIEATALNNMSDLYLGLGGVNARRRALGYARRALRLSRESDNRAGEAAALSSLAAVARDGGNLDEARGHIEATLGIVETLRGNVARRELRSSYTATFHGYYEFYIDLLMRLHRERPLGGFDAAALLASERARARGLLELLNEARGPHDTEPAQQTPLSLETIQKELDPDTLLLEYALGWERSYLWLVSPTEFKSFELPGRRAFDIAARSFHASLNTTEDIYADPGGAQALAVTSPNVRLRDVLKTPAGLSHITLGPVASLLGDKRLVIVADGMLQYIPFAALPDPAAFGRGAERMQPLGLRREVVNLPSMSAQVTTRRELAGRPPAPKDLAVLADPVFDADDVRVEKSPAAAQTKSAAGPRAGSGARPAGHGLERLAATRKEAEAIVKFVSADSAVAVFDFDASKAFATSGELSKYRHVLFATHGRLDSARPESSSVVLSLVDRNGNPQDGHLRLQDIYDLHLPAELVVLSGCQTALGSEIRGEGLVGLTRGFMHAGARRVVASLWSVDDEATAELMVRFYRGMLRDGKRPAEALRAAQIEMSEDERWRAPHYWAAFVLQGEWR